jgi:hypothetical protein
VCAIPQTFTIDADGVLRDQHIGDASIEARLKKLVGPGTSVEGRGGSKAVASLSAWGHTGILVPILGGLFMKPVLEWTTRRVFQL